MKKRLFLLTSLILTGLLALLAAPVTATPQQPQAFYQTPTPGADGRIIYIVKPGDSCLSISLLTGVELNDLRLLNNLDEECLLTEGKQLLLGVVTEPTVTPGPSPTPTQALPTPTPFNGSGEICVFLFEDLNGNALAEELELSIAGGAVSITDREGEVSLTGETTTDPEPLCFSELAEGEYNISVAPPEGYNPTTAMNYPLILRAGDRSILDFGAQLSSEAQPLAPSEGGRSPVMAIVGGLLLLGGIGLGVYFWRARKF
ncbi:hypothetical protein ADN00_08645 [Ornatilinea apprima]|uniref:LysM domain-containing protein n=1 Tax=Ornatilinea apprima TaxID=1134406 RepID=A0A0P6XBI4_9CHLR|nr:SdrD B-like domain-containing protein [Ornatilinea apprima]KPL77654.1 hypothetical protein ADN00_08645 [Ornatilinea apprima]